MLTAACARVATSTVLANDPRRAADELLAADRGFSAAAARVEPASAIGAMLARDAAMPTPRGDFARGAREIVEALRAALGPTAVRTEWTPIRSGVSADGHHGFTFGYMTVHRRDTASTAAKYLAYWVKQPVGWRVVAYKIGRRPAGEVSTSLMDPSLPARLVAPTSDSATIAGYRASLVAAERAFSDRAQRIGLGPAFVEYGRADAINLGGRDDASFVVGPEAIGRLVGSGGPANASPVSWSADCAIVASSGDLGVTFGFIRPNASAPEGARGTPFFTVWRRADVKDAWRYIAE
jgi:hypothetical protein